MASCYVVLNDGGKILLNDGTSAVLMEVCAQAGASAKPKIYRQFLEKIFEPVKGIAIAYLVFKIIDVTPKWLEDESKARLRIRVIETLASYSKPFQINEILESEIALQLSVDGQSSSFARPFKVFEAGASHLRLTLAANERKQSKIKLSTNAKDEKRLTRLYRSDRIDKLTESLTDYEALGIALIFEDD